MNALRDLFYVLAGTVVFLLIGLGMGHCQELGELKIPDTPPSVEWRVLPEYQPKQHFWQTHPTRTKVLTAIGVGSLGLVIGLAQRHNCPSFYIENGKKEPYDGTPPCPK